MRGYLKKEGKDLTLPLEACGVTENVINTNTLPPQCLCTGSFMQDTPPCINCLFSVTTQDDTYRPVLASAFDQCVSVYNAIPCPSFCGRVAPLVTYCNAIDNGTYPVSDLPPVGLPVSVSMSKPCICRDEYIQVVDECHSCVRDWDGVKAKEWLKSIEKCNTPAPTKTKTKQPPMQTPSPTAEQTVRPVESTAGISETKGNGASTIDGWLSSGVVVLFLAICLAGPDSLLWIFA